MRCYDESLRGGFSTDRHPVKEVPVNALEKCEADGCGQPRSSTPPSSPELAPYCTRHRISHARQALELRRKAERATPAKQPAAKTKATKPAAAKTPATPAIVHVASITLAQLLQAHALVEQLGGVEVATAIAAAIARGSK
jgi:hypothetical protein